LPILRQKALKYALIIWVSLIINIFPILSVCGLAMIMVAKQPLLQYTYAMSIVEGTIARIASEFEGGIIITLDCPPELIPKPGGYILAFDPGDADTVLPVPLFRVSTSPRATFQTIHGFPPGWGPGTTLALRGPLGQGFELPKDTRHLALVAINGDVSRLLPLINLVPDADVAIFSSAPLPSLPLTVEAQPLNALPESLAWADTLALDLTLDALPTLRQTLGLGPHERLPCKAQALVVAPMPCGAMADCGVCAVPARKAYKLACKDGPMFDLNQLQW
jgi:hypothetical protein